MTIYLPIAEMVINPFVFFGLGLLVGAFSGLFGIGGGFVLTPLLIFAGVPSPVAVATTANHVVASSFSSIISYFRQKKIDYKIGGLVLIGGVIGVFIGMQIFQKLQSMGQTQIFISLGYIILLLSIGGLMLFESLNSLRRARQSAQTAQRVSHSWAHRLPVRMKFRQSGLYVSAIPPILIGIGVGILSAILGVGGGFLLVPAMLYILKMPTKVVIGTSLFETICISSLTTMMHAINYHTVDMILAWILVLGGVIGAQLGLRFGAKIPAHILRIMLASVALSLCLALFSGLVLTPDELWELRWLD